MLALGFGTGWKVQGWRKDGQISAIHNDLQKAKDDARAERERVEALQRDAEIVAAELDAERRKKAKTVERVVTKEVVKYVQTRPVIECLDSVGVRIHDTAAVGLPETEDAAGGSDAETGAATNAEILQVVTLNYAICHDTENQLQALQDWVKAGAVE